MLRCEMDEDQSSIGSILYASSGCSAGPDATYRLCPEFAHIRCVIRQAVDPFIEPGPDTLGITRELVPLQIKRIVSIIVALDVRGMSPIRDLHHCVDDETGDERAVGIGTDDGLVHDLFDDDDYLAGSKGHLFLCA